MRRSDLVQTETRVRLAHTQIVFGERQHLLRVLDSLETTQVPQVRLNQERRVIEELIHERTKELNHINSSWDEKVCLVLNADSKAENARQAGARGAGIRLLSAPPDQRTPQGPVEDACPLAKHPYAAIREDVARHPNADATTLAWLSRDRSQPLWYLVAFNPNTPAVLRRKLQERLRS